MVSLTPVNGEHPTVSKNSFKLHQTADQIYLENPIFKNASVLSLSSSDDTLKVSIGSIPDKGIEASHTIHGILGILHLSNSKHLLVITSKTLISTLQAHKFWKITSVAAFQLPSGRAQTSEHVDVELLASILASCNLGHLYYSTSYDITHSLQMNCQNDEKLRDDRYWFNKHLLKDFIGNSSVKDWIIKVSCGFVSSIDIKGIRPSSEFSIINPSETSCDEIRNSKSSTFHVCLISRVNVRRLGTRYVRRGLDNGGNAANNVEMEQIIFNNDYLNDQKITSHVQIRGSVPALWSQGLDFSYRPQMKIMNIDEGNNFESTKKHFDDLKQQYVSNDGKIICVNLLDDKGFEGELTDTYEKCVLKYEDPCIKYEGFPINKWCKKYNFRNMDLLMQRIEGPLTNNKFFAGEGSLSNPSSVKIIQLQVGTTRVSCLDSLDRTNLTCTLFAKFMLPQQLSLLLGKGVADEKLIKVVQGHECLKFLTHLWADSGDAISILYAGTRALKADVTRTGRRQWIQGSIDDGLNSLTRFYLNNFADGKKQDAYDVLSGKISAEQIREMVVENEKKVSVAASKGSDDETVTPVEKKGMISRETGVGYWVPSFIIDRFEPVLKATLDFSTSSTSTITTTAAKTTPFLYSTSLYLTGLVNSYAPESVKQMLESFSYAIVFFYVLVVIKIFQLKGEGMVSRPLVGFEYTETEDID